MKTHRHVPIVTGFVCVVTGVYVFLRSTSDWTYYGGLLLFCFGAFSLRLGFFGSDDEIRRYTTRAGSRDRDDTHM